MRAKNSYPAFSLMLRSIDADLIFADQVGFSRTIIHGARFVSKPGFDRYGHELHDGHGSIGWDYSHYIIVDRVGWPLFSLSGEYWFIGNQGSYHGAVAVPDVFIATPQRWWPSWPCRLFPITPMMPGFLLNTTLYAVLAFALFAGPGAVRRTIRRRRGLCPACAYPTGRELRQCAPSAASR
jgi:hypothetical protein